jgi:hypothetical protein
MKLSQKWPVHKWPPSNNVTVPNRSTNQGGRTRPGSLFQVLCRRRRQLHNDTIPYLDGWHADVAEAMG